MANNHPVNRLFEYYRGNERAAVFISHTLVSLMVLCAVTSVVQLGEYIAAGWQGGYLLPVGFLVSMEAMYSWRYTRQFGFMSSEKLFYRLAEWVIILVGLKLVIYAVRGFDTLGQDMLLWRQDFLSNFFGGESLFAAAVVVVVWLISSLFAQDLAELEGDEKLLLVEDDGIIGQERLDTRRSLLNLVWVLGACIVFQAALARVSWRELWGERLPLQAGILPVIAYFCLALVLLSLTQYAVLRSRWSLNRVPVVPRLTWRWFLFSFFFLAAIALVALLLPTRYSLAFWSVLMIIIYFLNIVIVIILTVITTPFILFFSWLGSLLGKPTAVPPINLPQIDPRMVKPDPYSLWENIKAYLFWFVFFGVIVFSVYYYFQQHQALGERLVKFPLFHMAREAWHWLWDRLKGIKQEASRAVTIAFRRLIKPGKKEPDSQKMGYTSLRKLSPRQQVQFYFLAMVRRGSEKGLPRRSGQTPSEYSQAVIESLPEVKDDILVITEGFNEARYSRHEITAEHVGRVQKNWQRIRRAFRDYLRKT